MAYPSHLLLAAERVESFSGKSCRLQLLNKEVGFGKFGPSANIMASLTCDKSSEGVEVFAQLSMCSRCKGGLSILLVAVSDHPSHV
jgi:hypothetical protein